MKVKGEKNGKTKSQSPCRRDQMIYAIKYCQDVFLRKSTRIEPSFPPFDEPNTCNDCIIMDRKYNERLCFHNQVDLNTDLLDNVLLKRVIVQPTENPRSAGPHKSKLKTTTNQKRNHSSKQEIQECEYVTT